MSLTSEEVESIQHRNLAGEFNFAHNAPHPKNWAAVEAFERLGNRKYGPPNGQSNDKWMGIYTKEEREASPN